MSDPEQARMLIEAAERDLSALRGMRDVDVFADEIFGFHVQQAVEKSFKAWLALLGGDIPGDPQPRAFAEALRTRDPEAVRFEESIEYTLSVSVTLAPNRKGSRSVAAQYSRT